MANASKGPSKAEESKSRKRPARDGKKVQFLNVDIDMSLHIGLQEAISKSDPKTTKRAIVESALRLWFKTHHIQIQSD